MGLSGESGGWNEENGGWSGECAGDGSTAGGQLMGMVVLLTDRMAESVMAMAVGVEGLMVHLGMVEVIVLEAVLEFFELLAGFLFGGHGVVEH